MKCSQMAKSQTLKKEFYIKRYYIKFFIPSLRHGHLTPFDWKFLKFSTLRVKDLRKNVPILQEEGSTLAPPTLLVIRVVLLHTERFVKSFNSPTVLSQKNWGNTS